MALFRLGEILGEILREILGKILGKIALVAREQKITLGEMRHSGRRRLQV